MHLAADKPLTEALLSAGTTAVAYETVQLADKTLPLLTPMSEVAGRMASQVGAFYLSKFLGGRGLLLGGVPGVQAGEVVILGGGVVGTNAAKMGARAGGAGHDFGYQPLEAPVLRRRLRCSRIQTLTSTPANIAEMVTKADLLVGAVLIPGAKAPNLVTKAMVSTMKAGSVIVDVAVDQGGCIETSKPTTHDEPTFVVDDVVHYGVANMPGAVPNTSTIALSNQTLPYALELAKHGTKALQNDAALLKGLEHTSGTTGRNKGVGEAFGVESVAPGRCPLRVDALCLE